MILIANEGGALRLGVVGRLSLINSRMASALRMYGVAAYPRNASHVFSRCSQPSRAAQLTAVRPVNVRSPVTTPMRKADKYTGMAYYWTTYAVLYAACALC